MNRLLGPLAFTLAAVGAFTLPFTFVIAPVVLFLATWLWMRLDGKRLRDLRLTAWRHLGAGFAVGLVCFSGIALVQSLAVGVKWQFHPQAVIGAVTSGALFVLLSVIMEEFLFRGYAFQRLQSVGGVKLALAVSCLAFGAYHLIGRPYWAMGAVFQFAMPALGGLIFGYALLRSGGMALPMGLHLGGNFATLCLFGWNSGSATVFSTEVSASQIHTLVAPDVLPHLPYLTALAVMAVMIWRSRPPMTVAPGMR